MYAVPCCQGNEAGEGIHICRRQSAAEDGTAAFAWAEGWGSNISRSRGGWPGRYFLLLRTISNFIYEIVHL